MLPKQQLKKSSKLVANIGFRTKITLRERNYEKHYLYENLTISDILGKKVENSDGIEEIKTKLNGRNFPYDTEPKKQKSSYFGEMKLREKEINPELISKKNTSVSPQNKRKSMTPPNKEKEKKEEEGKSEEKDKNLLKLKATKNPEIKEIIMIKYDEELKRLDKEKQIKDNKKEELEKAKEENELKKGEEENSEKEEVLKDLMKMKKKDIKREAFKNLRLPIREIKNSSSLTPKQFTGEEEKSLMNFHQQKTLNSIQEEESPIHYAHNGSFLPELKKTPLITYSPAPLKTRHNSQTPHPRIQLHPHTKFKKLNLRVNFYNPSAITASSRTPHPQTHKFIFNSPKKRQIVFPKVQNPQKITHLTARKSPATRMFNFHQKVIN